MANPGDSGGGATITHGTSGITGSFRVINRGSEFTRAEVDVSHLASAAELRRQGDTADYGSFECEMLCNPAVALPSITALPETVTITAPKRVAGSAAAATLAGTAFITMLGPPQFVNNEANLIRYRFRWDGETPPAWTPEA